jgi:MFS family permease
MLESRTLTDTPKQASYIISFRATGHLIALAILLPIFDALLAKRYKESPSRKDLSLARISIVMITLGYAILVLSPGLVGICIGIGFYTLGTGFQAAIKSLLSSMEDKAMVGTVFTTLSLMDTVGALFAGPIDALVMKHALRMEGIWKSLPFMFALVLCAVSTCALAYVHIDGGRIDLAESGSDEESSSFLGSDSSRDNDGEDGSARDPRRRS